MSPLLILDIPAQLMMKPPLGLKYDNPDWIRLFSSQHITAHTFVVLILSRQKWGQLFSQQIFVFCRDQNSLARQT